jgi:hypothetical protein
MLEQINILDRYDETPKNRGQMSLFLEEMCSQLNELEKEEGITVEDEYALCEWNYVLEEIYSKYRDLVYDNVLFTAIGLCHVLRKRSAVEGMKKESYYE